MREPYIPSEHTLKGLKGAPSVWLKRFLPLFVPHGKVLDLACGCGRNTRLLGAQGFEVTALDIDVRCKPYIDAIAGARFVEADVENGPWPFNDETFDVVLVNFYLDRALFDRIWSVLKPSGYLIYETFMLPYAGFEGNRTKSPDFVLQPLELIDIFRDRMIILAYEQVSGEKGDCFQRFLACKRGESARFSLPADLS